MFGFEALFGKEVVAMSEKVLFGRVGDRRVCWSRRRLLALFTLPPKSRLCDIQQGVFVEENWSIHNDQTRGHRLQILLHFFGCWP